MKMQTDAILIIFNECEVSDNNCRHGNECGGYWNNDLIGKGSWRSQSIVVRICREHVEAK